MSESVVGVSVAAARQNAGSDAYAGTGPVAVDPGGTNAPAATTAADVIRAFVSVRVDRDSHGVANVSERPSSGRALSRHTPARTRTDAANAMNRAECRMW